MAKRKTTKSITAFVATWSLDPGLAQNPEGGQLIKQTAPIIPSAKLPTAISYQAPSAQVYALGTAEFRYWVAAAALSRGSAYWGGIAPKLSWQVGKVLPIELDWGNDLNAYYDREGLKFFHGNVLGRKVFSAESPDVVCHEQGHAILDALKPELWDAASLEASAFHEAFGDISSILCGLQIEDVRNSVLVETSRTIYRSSSLSKMACQLGWAIRQQYPTDVDPDCLRNAVNSFFYQVPESLPSSGPATVLSSESHSFSRVFTAAFYEALAGMFNAQSQQNEKTLLKVSTDIGKILVNAITSSAVVPAFFSQIAGNMVKFANSKFPTIDYAKAIRSAFVRHGILSPSVTSFAIMASVKKVAAAQRGVKKMKMNVQEYDLGVNEISVFTASESPVSNFKSAAPGLGVVADIPQDEAAKVFVERLLRRGRLKVTNTKTAKVAGIVAGGVERPNSSKDHPTFTHELRLEKNEYVLRRLRIDCGFH